MIQKKYTAHSYALCALFVLGNAAITMPFYKSGLLTFFISIPSSLGLLLLIELLLRIGQKNKIIFHITGFVLCAVALFGAVTAFFDYLTFLRSIELSQTRAIFLAVTLMTVIVPFCLCKTEVIYKYGLFVFVIIVVIVFLCLIGGIKTFDFKSFKTDFLGFSAKAFLSFVLPIAVLPIFTKQGKTSFKSVIFGTVAGFAMLAILICQAILTLGSNADISYPYLKAVSVISSGSLFTRLDGVVFFLFFVTSLMKITVCLKAFAVVIKNKKPSVK